MISEQVRLLLTGLLQGEGHRGKEVKGSFIASVIIVNERSILMEIDLIVFIESSEIVLEKIFFFMFLVRC